MVKGTILVMGLFLYPALIHFCSKLSSLRKKKKVQKLLQQEEHKLIQMEKFAVEKNERIFDL